MTFDRGRRAPVLAGLVALAVGAMVAGGATALRHGVLAGPGDTVSYAADMHRNARVRQNPPSLTSAPSPVPQGTPHTAHTTTTTTTTTSKPSTTTSTPPPTTTTTTTTTHDLAPSETARVLQLVNRARTNHGCAPLKSDSRLVAAAQGHSSDMSRRDYFSHDTPEGVAFDERIRAAGYPQPGAENIAMGQRSADEVMEAWMHSDGHRRNILNCHLRAIGVGLDTDGWYWTQDFGY